MVGRTNYTPPTNALAPQGPAQMTAIYQHFDALVGQSVASASNLPGSGNWIGREIFVEDTDIVYVCATLPSGWRKTPVRDVGNVTLEAGVTAPLLEVDKIGDLVYFSATFYTGPSAAATILAATLAAGFRPVTERIVGAASGDAAFNYTSNTFLIQPSGAIYVNQSKITNQRYHGVTAHWRV